MKEGEKTKKQQAGTIEATEKEVTVFMQISRDA